MKQKNKLLIGATGFLVMEGMTLIPRGKRPEDHLGEKMITRLTSPIATSSATTVVLTLAFDKNPGFPPSRE